MGWRTRVLLVMFWSRGFDERGQRVDGALRHHRERIWCLCDWKRYTHLILIEVKVGLQDVLEGSSRWFAVAAAVVSGVDGAVVDVANAVAGDGDGGVHGLLAHLILAGGAVWASVCHGVAVAVEKMSEDRWDV